MRLATAAGPDVAFAIRLLDTLTAAVIVIDRSASIVYANPRAVALLGQSADAMLGEPLATVVPEAAPEFWHDAEPSEDGHRFRCGYERPNRERLKLGFSVSPFRFDGGEPDAEFQTLIFQDVTAFEALAEERNRLLLLAAVGDTMPSILHELKNPLAAITTAVEVLLEEVPAGEVQRQLHAILGETRRMKLNLDGIGLASGDLRSLRFEAVDYALHEVCRILEPQMNSKGIAGGSHIETLPLLPFSAGVIRAIAFNLVNNAIHACRAGDRINLRAALKQGAVLELEVVDTGSGMSPEVLERCRELFYTTKSNGSGIGLALCRLVTEKAGGTLTIESTKGKGTKVTVHLPIDPAAMP